MNVYKMNLKELKIEKTRLSDIRNSIAPNYYECERYSHIENKEELFDSSLLEVFSLNELTEYIHLVFEKLSDVSYLISNLNKEAI